MIQNTNYGASKTYVDTALEDKVDKLTTTGTKAYTHDGVTQGEISLEDGQTANTIPIRDANGRMHAADPASGATDKTLVTANWVSQSGAGKPNNLVHDLGNENIGGLKTFDSIFASYLAVNEVHFVDDGDTTAYRQVYVYDMTGGAQYHHVFLNITQRRYAAATGIAKITINRNGSASIVWLAGNVIDVTKLVITKEANNIFTLWYRSGNSAADGLECDVLFEIGGNGPNLRTTIPTDTNWYNITSSGYTDSDSNVHTFLDYSVSTIGSMI